MIINPIPEYSIIRKLDDEKKEKEQQEPPKLYKIVQGDNLTKIAEAHQTTAQRLFEANPNISDPNVITTSEELKIPKADEVLAERAMPVTIESTVLQEGIVKLQTSAPSGRSSVSGNTYYAGYCTHYAKQRRPDIPNNLGNADTWYVRYNGPKGTAPQAGAIGVAKGYMHVVYVESVNGDGTVNISEMNYSGWNVVSSRTAPASEFLYIY